MRGILLKIKDDNRFCEIKWNNLYASFCIFRKNTNVYAGKNFTDLLINELCEVIGNTYENPELLNHPTP